MEKDKSSLDYLKEAYAQALEALQTQAKLTDTPAAAALREARTQTLRLASELLALDILNEEISGEYEALSQRITAKRSELERLYGIAATASSAQAVRDAHAALLIRFQAEFQAGEEGFSGECEALTQQTQAQIDEQTAIAEVKLAELERQTNDLRTGWKQESDREKAEYDYQLKRSRKQAQEERARTVAARAEALAQREQTAQAELDARQARLQTLDAMQAQVDGIPAQLEKAAAAGASQRAKELEREYGHQNALAKKDQEHRLRALNEELERLKEKYAAVVAEKAALAQRLDQVNAESRKLTSDTVRSIGGINILNSDGHAAGAAKK